MSDNFSPKHTREIGSDFNIPLRVVFRGLIKNNHRSDTNKMLLASGRDALHWILKSLSVGSGDVALLPSYLCVEILKPFLDLNIKVEFYSIDSMMRIDAEDLKAKLTPNVRILLYINYWGFPLDIPITTEDLTRYKSIVLEDNTHSLLSTSNNITTGHIRFASYRKLLPVIDGAEVSWDDDINKHLRPIQLRKSISHKASICTRTAAIIIKSIWIYSHGLYPKNIFRSLFSLSEKLLDQYPKPSEISNMSFNIYASLELDAITAIRRSNFLTLQAAITDIGQIRPLYDHLPDNTCPMGFPIIANKRDNLKNHLINRHIYPPIHWIIPNQIDSDRFPESWKVSNNILTLPIDQRYSQSEMIHIATEIRNFYEAI
jgi:dTDP-4-amino-4,6-dideoxygalactose transaminase